MCTGQGGPIPIFLRCTNPAGVTCGSISALAYSLSLSAVRMSLSCPTSLPTYSTNKLLLQWVCPPELASDRLAHIITKRAQRDRKTKASLMGARCARRRRLALIVLESQTRFVAMGARLQIGIVVWLHKPTIALLNPRAIVTNGQYCRPVISQRYSIPTSGRIRYCRSVSGSAVV